MPASTALAAPLQILASPRSQGRSSSLCEILSTWRSRVLRSSANTGHASMTRTAPDTIALQVLDMLVTELPPMTGARPMTDFKPGVIMGILINQIRADCTCWGQWATYVQGEFAMAKESDFKRDEMPFVAPCRKLSPWAPFRWVKLGISDLVRTPQHSMAYGLTAALVIGIVCLLAWFRGSQWIMFAMLGG